MGRKNFLFWFNTDYSNSKRKAVLFTFTFFAVVFALAFFAGKSQAVCGECSQGQTRCNFRTMERCRLTSPSCLEWSSADECAGIANNQRCSGSYLQTCVRVPASCEGGDTLWYWGNDYLCSGNTSCGYGTCQASQRPVWTCSIIDYQPSCVYNCSFDSNCCIDECASEATRCLSASQKQTCGQYDSDICAEWGNTQTCSGDTSCGSGTCQDNERPVWNCSNNDCNYSCLADITCCSNECSSPGQKQCFDFFTKQTCGNFDSDQCLEWKNETCSGDTSCGYGTCQDNQKPTWKCSGGSCTYTCADELTCCKNECQQSGESKCLGAEEKQTCGNYDPDSCLEWSTGEDCSKSNSCGFGKCKDTEKPVWSCAGQGACDYNCVSDSVCQAARDCTDDCSLEGKIQCFGDTEIKTCGYYDTDVCLDWSPSQECSGPANCGYGNCQTSQKPVWKCFWEKCDYNCVGSPECSTSPPPPTCKDECSQKGQTQCLDDISVQVCDVDFDSDSCLEWGDAKPCQGETNCGSSGCQSNQRPSWSCSGEQCAFRCVDDGSCQGGSVPVVCGDLICDSGESIDCPQDCEKPSFAILVAVKKEKQKDWKEEGSFNPREKFDVRLTVKNNSQRDFSAVTARAAVPQEIIYERDLKIDDVSSRTDIRYGLDLGFFPANTEKNITFKTSVSSKVKTEMETEISVTIEAENLTASDTSKIIIEKPSGGAKWYWWLLAILIITAIIAGFSIWRTRTQAQI